MQETQVSSLGQEDPLEKEMATYSSILAWEIPWIEESARLQQRHYFANKGPSSHGYDFSSGHVLM